MFLPLHGSLERVDGVDLGDDDPAAESAEGLGAALADIAVASDASDLDNNFDTP